MKTLNHCHGCGRRTNAGRTHHTSYDAVTCLLCETKRIFKNVPVGKRGWQVKRGEHGH